MEDGSWAPVGTLRNVASRSGGVRWGLPALGIAPTTLHVWLRALGISLRRAKKVPLCSTLSRTIWHNGTNGTTSLVVSRWNPNGDTTPASGTARAFRRATLSGASCGCSSLVARCLFADSPMRAVETPDTPPGAHGVRSPRVTRVSCLRPFPRWVGASAGSAL